MGLRQVYERRKACRQAGVYQIVLQRFERPRASDLSNQQRLGSPRFSDGGSLDQLRFGKREGWSQLRRDGRNRLRTVLEEHVGPVEKPTSKNTQCKLIRDAGGLTQTTSLFPRIRTCLPTTTCSLNSQSLGNACAVLSRSLGARK